MPQILPPTVFLQRYLVYFIDPFNKKKNANKCCTYWVAALAITEKVEFRNLHPLCL